jgi:hypothetical protein
MDLSLSEDTIYGVPYYTVYPVITHDNDWDLLEDWCVGIMGLPGDIWELRSRIWIRKDQAPTPYDRWYMNTSKFWFRDEADRAIFLLRWA